MWARIEGGRFNEAVLVDPVGKFPEELVFVELPDKYVPLADSSWTYSEESGWQTTNMPMLEAKLLNNVASVRWDLIEKGTVVWEGNSYATDKETQGLIGGNIQTGKRIEELGATFTTRWKSKTGFVPLTLANLQDMGLAVAQFVQGMFDLEGDVTEAVLEAESTIDDKLDAYNTAYDLYIKPLLPEEPEPVEIPDVPAPVFTPSPPLPEPEPVTPPPGIELQEPPVVVGRDPNARPTSDVMEADVTEELEEA